jgi:hypothetical protein
MTQNEITIGIFVIPAQAGIQNSLFFSGSRILDPGLRRGDECPCITLLCKK